MRFVWQGVLPFLALFIVSIHGASLRRVSAVDNAVESISSELHKTRKTEVSKQYVSQKAVECNCGRNSRGCFYNGNGFKICTCLPGYSQINGTCLECDCGRNSRYCEFDKNGRKSCQCQMRYAERNGTCAATCTRHSDCINGSICRQEERGRFCGCPPNFRGEQCEVNELCEKLVPSCESKGAYCVFNSSEADCQCPVGQTISLISGVCEGGCNSTCVHGTCEVAETGFYECRCEDQFLGINCDEASPHNPVLAGVIIGVILTIVFSCVGTYVYAVRTKNEGLRNCICGMLECCRIIALCLECFK